MKTLITIILTTICLSSVAQIKMADKIIIRGKSFDLLAKAKVIELTTKYKIECIAFDRWNASQLVIQLTNDGANMKPFGQGFISMTNIREYQ